MATNLKTRGRGRGGATNVISASQPIGHHGQALQIEDSLADSESEAAPRKVSGRGRGRGRGGQSTAADLPLRPPSSRHVKYTEGGALHKQSVALTQQRRQTLAKSKQLRADIENDQPDADANEELTEKDLERYTKPGAKKKPQVDAAALRYKELEAKGLTFARFTDAEPRPIHTLPPEKQAWYEKYVPGYVKDFPASVPRQAQRASSPAPMNGPGYRPPLVDGAFRANASDPAGHYNPPGARREEEEEAYSERLRHQQPTANVSEERDDSYEASEPRGHKRRLSQVLDDDDEQQGNAEEEEEDELDAFVHRDQQPEGYEDNEEHQGYELGDGGYAEGDAEGQLEDNIYITQSRYTSDHYLPASSLPSLSDDGIEADRLASESLAERPAKKRRGKAPDVDAPSQAGDDERAQQNGHLRLREYDGTQKTVVQASTNSFKVMMVVEDPLAKKAAEIALATKAWKYACKVMKFNGGDITEQIRKTITKNGTSNIRGIFLQRVRPNVSPEYGFKAPSTDPNASPAEDEMRIQENKDLYTYLTHNLTFTFARRNRETGARSYPYQHRWIGECIRDQFFTDSDSIGIEMEKYLNPISVPFLAFMYTLNQFCLDEWKDGYYKRGNFSASAYREKYNLIVNDIKSLLDDPMSREVIEGHQRRLFVIARSQCGATKVYTKPVEPNVKKADIANVAKDGLLEY